MNIEEMFRSPSWDWNMAFEDLMNSRRREDNLVSKLYPDGFKF